MLQSNKCNVFFYAYVFVFIDIFPEQIITVHLQGPFSIPHLFMKCVTIIISFLKEGKKKKKEWNNKKKKHSFDINLVFSCLFREFPSLFITRVPSLKYTRKADVSCWVHRWKEQLNCNCLFILLLWVILLLWGNGKEEKCPLCSDTL